MLQTHVNNDIITNIVLYITLARLISSGSALHTEEVPLVSEVEHYVSSVCFTKTLYEAN